MLPVEGVLGLCLEEVHKEEELVGGGVHEVLEHGPQQDLEGEALVLRLRHVDQDRLPLDLQRERGRKRDVENCRLRA